MKRAAIVIALILAISAAVDVLGDLTQSRPDERNERADTEVVVAIDENRFNGGSAAAAAALWAVCAPQTSSRLVDGSGPEHIGDGRYRIVLYPAVGAREQRKLIGCLEDFTVERVRGGVVSFRAVPATTSSHHHP
jgi:hypothetical protein